MTDDAIRKITVQAAGPGVAETTAALEKLAAAQNHVAVASDTEAKAHLSSASALNALQRSLDSEFRSEQNLEKVHRTLTAARNEGLISITRENELLTLAADKYRVAGESAEVMKERLATAKEAALGLAAGLGAGLVLGGLAELPMKIMEINHEAAGLTHTAEVIGITTDKLQELQYAGSLMHVSTESMDQALEKFSKNLAVASTGTGELAKILKANHVVISGDVTKDFMAYADLVEHAKNAEDRNLLTTTAFGKSAEEMGLLFEEGGRGIDEATAAAERNGAVLGGAALQNARDLDAQWTITSSEMSTDMKNLAIDVAPLLEGELKQIADEVRAIGDAFNAIKTANLTDAAGALSRLNSQLNPLAGANNFVMTQGLRFGNWLRGGGSAPAANSNSSYETPPSAYDPLHITVSGAHTIVPSAPDAGAAKQASEIQKVTEALNLQIKNLTETNRQQSINNELAKAHVTAASREGQAIAALAGKYYDEKKAIDDTNQAANFLAQTTESAIEGFVTGSTSAVDAIGNIAKALASAVLQAELLGSGPLAGILGTSPTTSGGAGGLLGSLFSAFIPHAQGGVYDSPSLSAYSGRIVSEPTFFKFASGGGVMGEAGPEAIMPLQRGPDGRLGVAAANGNSPSAANDTGMTIHIAIDARGAQEGQATQIAAAVRDTLRYQLPTAIRQYNRNPSRVGYSSIPVTGTGK